MLLEIKFVQFSDENLRIDKIQMVQVFILIVYVRASEN